MIAVQVRKDISVKEIYSRAKLEKDAEARSRMLAIAAVLEGKERKDAAKIAGLTINNFRTWIKRFNEGGLDSLENKKIPGPQSAWTNEMVAFLHEKTTRGAVFEEDGRVCFRLEDFQSMIEKKFSVRYCVSSIWYKLKELNLSWISVRQQHPKTNIDEQEKFKKKFRKKFVKFNKNIQTNK